MRSGIPVPGSTRARLLEGALTAFGRHGFEPVSVTELAEQAGVTIGSLYHHFGSKLGLYDLVRSDVERRLLDRMEGAAEAGAPVGTVLLLGYDYLVRSGFARLLSEPHPDRAVDPVSVMISERADHDGRPVGQLLVASWRAALDAAGQADPTAVRAALGEVLT